MRTVAVVQARQGSSRLPGKSVMPISGRPMLAHVIERAGRVRTISEVVVVTSVNERDAPIATLAEQMGCLVVRGDERDVLSRFASAIDLLGLTAWDRVMRVTGDCPLLCTDVCERVLTEAGVTDWFDFWTADTTCSGYPDGTDCELMTVRALRSAHSDATLMSDREHVTPWIRRNLRERLVLCPTRDPGYAAAKWSVDVAEDLTRVRAIYGEMVGGGAYTLPDVTAAWRRAEQRGR